MKRTLFVLFTLIVIAAAVPAFAADSKYEIGVVYIATAIINESGATTDHACRMDIATEWWRSPAAKANDVSPFLSAQSISPASTQQQINDQLSAYVTTEVKVRKAEGSCAP